MTAPLVLAQHSTLPTELSPHDQARVEQIVTETDITDPTTSIAYGAKTMHDIAQFSNNLLTKIKAKDADMVGEQLTDLLIKVKGVNLQDLQAGKSSFLERIPLLNMLFRKVERKIIEHQTLATQVDGITKQLENAMVALLHDIESLEQLFQHNRNFYNDISLYIIAGQQRLEQFKQIELPEAQLKAQQSGDMMEAQSVRDMMDRVQRFERRLHDLEISRTIATQTAPQIRLLQSNNQTLTEKIQSSILSTIPLWKSQIVLALSITNQRKAAKLQKDIADTTNEMLRHNAAMLEQSSIETSREVERSIVDIDTLREVQDRLLHSIEETLSIASEARVRRQDVQQELHNMENELRERMVALANQQTSM